MKTNLSNVKKVQYITTVSKPNTKVKYNCSNDEDDDDYIEVNTDSETFTYTDEDGQTWEINTDDVIEYDKDDEGYPSEITYVSKSKTKKPQVKAKQTALPLALIAQRAFARNR